MSYASVATNPRTAIVIAVVGLASALLIAGSSGLIGMSLGLFGAAVGVAGLILATRLAGGVATAGAKPGLGVLLTLIVFAAKVPLYFALWTLSRSLGEGAPGCFLAGVVLVYFCLVAWAVSR